MFWCSTLTRTGCGVVSVKWRHSLSGQGQQLVVVQVINSKKHKANLNLYDYYNSSSTMNHQYILSTFSSRHWALPLKRFRSYGISNENKIAKGVIIKYVSSQYTVKFFILILYISEFLGIVVANLFIFYSSEVLYVTYKSFWKFSPTAIRHCLTLS